MITPKIACALWLGAALGSVLLTGCETTNTTVVNARTGRPVAHAKIEQSDGTVRYTDAEGNAMRTSGTTATVHHAGYRSAEIDQ